MMEPIQLSLQEIVSGLTFSRQIKIAEALAEAAKVAEGQFIEHLRLVHNVPAGWVLRDWTVGFVEEQHGEHYHQ